MRYDFLIKVKQIKYAWKARKGHEKGRRENEETMDETIGGCFFDFSFRNRGRNTAQSI